MKHVKSVIEGSMRRHVSRRIKLVLRTSPGDDRRHRDEVLDHELQRPLLVVRHRAAVAMDPGLRYHPALGRVGRPADAALDYAVCAGHRIVEQLVALHAYDFVDGEAERLLPRAVHPYDGMLRIMDDYDVVHEVQYHVHELFGVDVLLAPAHASETAVV